MYVVQKARYCTRDASQETCSDWTREKEEENEMAENIKTNGHATLAKPMRTTRIGLTVGARTAACWIDRPNELMSSPSIWIAYDRCCRRALRSI